MDKRRKVVYIISDIDKALAFEWIAKYVDHSRIALSFILLNPGNSALEQYVKQYGLPVYRVQCRGKQDWVHAIRDTYILLKRIQPYTVHCHLIQATIIGLLAAKMAGIKQRIYTRHHSSLHHIYHKKGVWWDKLSNSLSTHIIAISGNVKDILVRWERVPVEKVYMIPHGFKLDDFSEIEASRINGFKLRYKLAEHYPIIGVIARFTEWKGIQYIIPAFEKLLSDYPDAVLILMNANGDYEDKLTKQLKTIPSSAYRLIKFEKDIAAAYKAMDLFVHVPIDYHSEAFGQIYVEALMAGVPSVFTLSGIANDFIKDGDNALVVPYKNVEEVYKALVQILKNEELKYKLVVNGKNDVFKKFSIENMIQSLESLYGIT